MKTPLRKLRSAFHTYKQCRKDGKVMPLDRLDELDKASEDMQEMRDSYDSLLSSAAAAASSAYEFSESLKDMGSCLLRKVAINDDEETGKVLLMLGKVQFELHRLVDNYRTHIFQTITVPSESLVNELQNVEEMKRQCDEKRVLYEHMRSRHKEKGRSKSGKGETYTSQQLQMAREQFDQDATLFVFRLKSLKQGQSRSLLTQTARHHAAQLSFFRKALKALEAVDPHVQSVTRQQYIDYQFSGLDDDESEDDDDYSDGDYNGDSEDSNGELSFDYRHNGRQGSVSATRKLAELDVDITFPSLSRVDMEKENIQSAHGNYDFRDHKLLSQSAPLFPQRKVDPAERIRQLRPSSSKKFHTCVLPKPGDTNNDFSPVFETSTSHAMGPLNSQDMSYSMPLEVKNNEKHLATAHFSGPIGLNSQNVLKENNCRLPPQFAENISSSHFNRYSTSDAIKIKRLSQSGPITSRPMSTAISPYARKLPEFSSGPIPRSSPNISASGSATFMSSPRIRISELHELPRPPNPLDYISSRPSGFVGHSAPLGSGGQENKSSVSKKLTVTWAASPLPAPPVASPTGSPVPSSSPRADIQLPSAKQLEGSSPERGKDNRSPPLTPPLSSDAPPE
ncbi:hypothetical protein Droror1_Dr00018750 [Drosera rotundifolia]